MTSTVCNVIHGYVPTKLGVEVGSMSEHSENCYGTITNWTMNTEIYIFMSQMKWQLNPTFSRIHSVSHLTRMSVAGITMVKEGTSWVFHGYN